MKNKPALEVIGVTAVVVSLLFVGYEIRQSNRIAMVQAEYELRNNFTDLNQEVVTNPELLDFLIRISTDGEELEGADALRARVWTWRLMNIWVAVDLAYHNGLASEQTYLNVLTNVDSSIRDSSPAMRKIWRESSSSFPELADSDVMRRIQQELDRAETAERSD